MPGLTARRFAGAPSDAAWRWPGAAGIAAIFLASAASAAPRTSLEPAVTEGAPQEAEADADSGSSPVVTTPLPLLGAYRLFGGFSFGRGLRFNNPYRLETQLGDDARSLSATAPYVALSLGAAAGRSALQHGVFVSGAIAIEGIPQEVISPAYLLLYRPEPRWGLRGRGGLAVVVEPDLNAGFEAAFGGLLQLTGGIGVTVDLVGSLFYGAATLESSRTAIPVASLEIGVAYEYEVLP